MDESADYRVMDQETPLSPSIIDDLDELLRGIPSPPSNLFELYLDEAKAREDEQISSQQSTVIDSPYESSDSTAITISDGSHGWTRGSDDSEKSSDNPPGQFVLKFSARDLISYFATATKGNSHPKDLRRKRRQEQKQRNGEMEESSSAEVTVPARDDKRPEEPPPSWDCLETEHQRLREENANLLKALESMKQTNVDISIELEAQLTILYTASALVPYLVAAMDDNAGLESDTTTKLRFPFSAIMSANRQMGIRPSCAAKSIPRGKLASSNHPASTGVDHDYYAASETKRKNLGICLHIYNNAVHVELCVECGESAAKRHRTSI